MQSLTGKKIVIVIANENFRDEEYVYPRAVLEHAGAEIVTTAMTMDTATGLKGTRVMVNIALHDLLAAFQRKVVSFDAVLFIGGKGAAVYWEDADAHALVHETLNQKKILGAICIAPGTLAYAGVLNGKKATSFPSVEQILIQHGATYTGNPVEIDGDIITANGAEAAKAFGTAIGEALIQQK